MRKSFLCISVLILISACTPEDQKIPKDILSIDSMKVIVWQMTVAGNYAQRLKDEDTTIKSLNTAYLNIVLQLHHTDKKTFFKSFDFYQAHPPLEKILFDSVNNYATRQRTLLFRRIQ